MIKNLFVAAGLVLTSSLAFSQKSHPHKPTHHFYTNSLICLWPAPAKDSAKARGAAYHMDKDFNKVCDSIHTNFDPVLKKYVILDRKNDTLYFDNTSQGITFPSKALADKFQEQVTTKNFFKHLLKPSGPTHSI